MKKSPTNSPSKSKVNLNNYEIIKQIKKGSLSSVYAIRCKNTKNYLAAKVIFSDKNELKNQNTIDHQIMPLIRIQHPTTIKYYGYSLKDFDGKNNITIIMDLIKNGSLTNYIRNIKSSSLEVFYDNTSRQKILVGIACGMMHLNLHNATPIGLTPNKILFDEYFNPLISYFTLGQEPVPTKSNLIYLAPETITNGTYNIKTDVYSFGIIMYEIITGLIPFPNFQNNELDEYQFKNKIVSENYRPEFRTPIKQGLKSLIEKCWANDPNMRPTFDDIFKKLAFNLDESINDNNDEKYYLDGIDVNELFTYITFITKNDAINVNEYMKKPHEPKAKFTISRFNSIPLKSQQIIISKIINDSPNNKDILFLTKINNLLLFLLKFKVSENVCYVGIQTIDNEDTLEVMKEEDDSLIQIHFNAIEMIYKNKKLKSIEFINILDQFDDLSIELKYPSDSFNEIYEIISEIKKEKIERLKIDVYISGIRKTDEMFTYKTDINSIKFDSSFSSIGRNSFSGSLSLTEMTIPSSINAIEKDAFLGCSSLTKVIIPNTVTSIGDKAFYECTLLREISIPSSVTFIGKASFYLCSSLPKIIIPSSVTAIEDGTFVECSSLKKVIIPSSIQSIGECAFSRCTSLPQITIPESVTNISKGAFYLCSSISEILIPSSLTEIEEHEFQECKNLKKVTIPSSIKVIKECAFCKCTSLSEIEIPSSVTSIKKGAFYNCISLKKINIPSSITLIESGTFQNCKSLETISIPSSITEIGDSAFRDCSKLAKIIIPSSVNKIGVGVFYNCISLKEIEIPSSVSSINAFTFQGCSSLSKVIIPSSITEIGKHAFSGCSSLKSVAISSSLISIDDQAFPKTTKVFRK